MNDGLIPIVPELHHLAKTHALKTLDQVINAWEFFLIGPVDPSTLLHRPIDEFTPKEFVLHRQLELGRKGVSLPLVAFLAAILLVLDGALPGIVNLGSISQTDGTNPIFLVLVITKVNLNLIERRSLSLRSFCWTLAMPESLLILLPLEHGSFLIIDDVRRSGPFGSPHVRWHHALTRCLTATLLLDAWFLLAGTPTR